VGDGRSRGYFRSCRPGFLTTTSASSTITSPATFGWSKSQITLGFPLAALLTIWAGPLLIHRFSPRRLILIGTGFTFVALLGFGKMGGALTLYYLFWVVYTVGYILSGPIPHQIIVSNWFKKSRGKAMGIVYVGVGLIGAMGSYIVKPLTANFGFHTALVVLGFMMFITWPVALFVLKDRPSDVGEFPGWRAAAAQGTVSAIEVVPRITGQFPVLAAADRQLLFDRLHRGRELPYEVRFFGCGIQSGRSTRLDLERGVDHDPGVEHCRPACRSATSRIGS
jgi:MFS family permease